MEEWIKEVGSESEIDNQRNRQMGYPVIFYQTVKWDGKAEFMQGEGNCIFIIKSLFFEGEDCSF